jgi:hypothetical protein
VKITRFDPDGDLIIVPGRIWGPRGESPRLNMVLDTGSAETVIIPDVLDEIGYSARSADRITVMRSAVGREEGYLIHVERFACLGFQPRSARGLGHSRARRPDVRAPVQLRTADDRGADRRPATAARSVAVELARAFRRSLATRARVACTRQELN